MKHDIFIATSFLIICFFSLNSTSKAARDKCYQSDWQNVERISATVYDVVDGDTVKINYKNKLLSVRLLSIDTAETNYLGQNQGYWAYLAKDALVDLLPGNTKIIVEFDAEKCDAYGRVLGYIWKEKTNINRLLLTKALAVNYCIYPNIKYCTKFAKIVEKNIAEKNGIFSDPNFEIPYDWRRRVSRRNYEKFVGNIFTQKVYNPRAVEDISVSERIFFFKKEHIKPPFYYID